MEYEIVISETCLEEIDAICNYIEENLKAEYAAKRLRRKIINTIQQLKHYPRIYAKLNKKDRKGRFYRRISIDNYILIYTIIEEDKTILILHMYYSGRNYLNGGLL